MGVLSLCHEVLQDLVAVDGQHNFGTFESSLHHRVPLNCSSVSPRNWVLPVWWPSVEMKLGNDNQRTHVLEKLKISMPYSCNVTQGQPWFSQGTLEVLVILFA